VKEKLGLGLVGIGAEALRIIPHFMEDDDIDMITLISPIGIHYVQEMKAIESGKHIHINKTLTVTKKEANNLINYAKEKNIKITASPRNMLFPMNQRKRKLILEGKLGNLFGRQDVVEMPRNITFWYHHVIGL
jgi:predicted dehydrogenase